MPFYKYRTDLGNTVIDKSIISFIGLTGNEAQISSVFDTPNTQPLYLYKISGSTLQSNDDTTISSYLNNVNVTINSSPTNAEFTGYTTTTNNIITNILANSITGATSLGGNNIFTNKIGNLLQFKGLSAGNNIFLTPNSTGITISSYNGYGRIIFNVTGNTSAGSNLNTDYLYFCNGNLTITLPTAINNYNKYTIKNIGIGKIIISTINNQYIDDNYNIIIDDQYTSIDLISDNSNWRIL